MIYELPNLRVIEAMWAVKNSPIPWHVRLGGYRVGLPISQTIPQWLADEWTALMQEAVMLWAKGEMMVPDLGRVDDLDDEMVSKRIAAYQTGYDKEWGRREAGGYWSDFEGRRMERYIFADMPMSMQRAIVSRWDAAHAHWMEEHPQARYTPDFGYHWRITLGEVTVKVKMYDDVDKGSPPNRELSENWEMVGIPGGLWGWIGAAASQGSECTWLYIEGEKPPDLRVNKRAEESGSGHQETG